MEEQISHAQDRQECAEIDVQEKNRRRNLRIFFSGIAILLIGLLLLFANNERKLRAATNEIAQLLSQQRFDEALDKTDTIRYQGLLYFLFAREWTEQREYLYRTVNKESFLFLNTHGAMTPICPPTLLVVLMILLLNVLNRQVFPTLQQSKPMIKLPFFSVQAM